VTNDFVIHTSFEISNERSNGWSLVTSASVLSRQLGRRNQRISLILWFRRPSCRLRTRWPEAIPPPRVAQETLLVRAAKRDAAPAARTRHAAFPEASSVPDNATLDFVSSTARLCAMRAIVITAAMVA